MNTTPDRIASSAFSNNDWSDLLVVGEVPPLFRTFVSATITIETDAAALPSAAAWPVLDGDQRRSLFFELGELHLVRVALGRLPDSARSEADRRQLAEVDATDHVELTKQMRAILADVRRGHADAESQALNGHRLRGHEAEAYRRLRIVRALVCGAE